MARFQFVAARIRDIDRAPHPVVAQHAYQALARGPTNAPLPGAGWYESSWDLQRGLEVHEGLPADAPLDDWLEACLLGMPASRCGSTVAERDVEPGAGFVPTAPHGAVGHALQFGDLHLAVAAEVTHLDELGEFGIDQLELA
jgi:hypothetical protein